VQPRAPRREGGPAGEPPSGRSPLLRALEPVRRPLELAAQDGFSRAGRIRNLEETVHRAAAAAAGLRIPPDARSALSAVAKRFAEPVAPELLAAAVTDALERTSGLMAPGFADAVLARPLTVLPGVAERRAETLARRGLRTLSDLVFLLPTRYEDRRRLTLLADLQVGQRATFVARVKAVESSTARVRGRLQRVLQVLVSDDSGTIRLKWFHGAEHLRERLAKGVPVLVSGEVRRWRFDPELLHPDLELLDEEDSQDGAALRRVVPVYASVEGVPPRTLRRLVERALERTLDVAEGLLPEWLAGTYRLPPLHEALARVHAPEPEADVEALLARRSPAHQRLVLEELFLLELGLGLRRSGRAREPGVALAAGAAAARRAARSLPFRLTDAQSRACREILSDLQAPHPMHRLLQGDVGSGKTVVAFLAAVAARAEGHQGALLAPTELLAEQHARSLARLQGAGPGAPPLRMALLTASQGRAEAGAARSALASGEIDLVVGTHALLGEDVRFRSLALVVVDEQHRFGVAQRRTLLGRGADGRVPHLLVMTATPIPRTLALTLYGDLDLSVIDELPPGRQPVSTDVLRPGEGRRVLDLLRQTLARGEQAYVVYPLVEESEKTDLRAASESVERLQRALPEARIDLVHGQLDATRRGEAMARFERGETAVLVSTSVVEVGVDVANATLMIVEHAERFGLAQLHQLRGRVGRGERPGTCLLLARGGGADSEARLRAMMETRDGFAIADADLRIRGPGEFLGTRQSGRLPDLRIADLLRDGLWLERAREAARRELERDPWLRRSPVWKRAVERRFGERLALVDVG